MTTRMNSFLFREGLMRARVVTLSVRMNTTMRCPWSLSMFPDPLNFLVKTLFDDVHDSFITRIQRLAQRFLKRNLGDRTWNTGEISSELRRLNDDVQNYLSVHTVSRHNTCTLWIFRMLKLRFEGPNLWPYTLVRHQTFSRSSETTILQIKCRTSTSQVAELNYFMQTRTEDGLRWAP